MSSEEHGSTESPAHASTESLAEDLTGKELGGFRILRRLGTGAMADVYLADQSSPKDDHYVFAYTITISNEGATYVHFWSTDGNGALLPAAGPGCRSSCRSRVPARPTPFNRRSAQKKPGTPGFFFWGR